MRNNKSTLLQELRQIWRTWLSLESEYMETLKELESLWSEVGESRARVNRFLQQQRVGLVRTSDYKPSMITSESNPYHEFIQSVPRVQKALQAIMDLKQEPRSFHKVHEWKADRGTFLGLRKATLVAFSPSGNLLASGATDKKVKIWDIPTGRLLRTFIGHKGQVLCVAFSPDGHLVASGATDKTVRVWEVENGRLLCTLRGHEESVRSVMFSPDGSQLASGAGDKTIKMWEVESRRVVQTLQGHNEMILSIAFSPDARLLASGSADTTVKVWEVESGRLVRTLHGGRGWVQNVVFSPDGRLLVAGMGDSTIKVWEVENGHLLQNIRGHEKWVLSIVFSPDGLWLISGSGDKTVKMWEVESGRLIYTLGSYPDVVWSIALSPDGEWLAVASGATVILYRGSWPDLQERIAAATQGIATVQFWYEKARAHLASQHEASMAPPKKGYLYSTWSGERMAGKV